MGGDDDAAQLAEAARQPWEERFKHSFWKARVVAYECVGKESAAGRDVRSSDCLRAFGASLSPKDVFSVASVVTRSASWAGPSFGVLRSSSTL